MFVCSIIWLNVADMDYMLNSIWNVWNTGASFAYDRLFYMFMKRIDSRRTHGHHMLNICRILLDLEMCGRCLLSMFYQRLQAWNQQMLHVTMYESRDCCESHHYVVQNCMWHALETDNYDAFHVYLGYVTCPFRVTYHFDPREICHSWCIEDEIHFISVFPAYFDLRQMCIPDI